MDYTHLSAPGGSRQLMIRRVRKAGDGSITVLFVDPKNPRQEPVRLRLSPDDVTAILTDVDTVYRTGETVEKTLSKEIEDELPPSLRTPR